jgi:Domain of unknown function (DUF4878)
LPADQAAEIQLVNLTREPYFCSSKNKKMKKLTTYFVLISTVMILVTGCKGKDKAVENDPKAVVTAFFERMSKKDLDGAAKLATKESKATIDMMKKAIDAAEKMGVKDTSSKDDPSGEFKKMEIGEVKIDGDNATVAVTNHAKGDKVSEFPLKKEGGEWKVDFSMGTLMKMGMDEASKMHNDNNPMNTDSTGIQDMMNDTMNKNVDTTSHM